jgi:cytochrome c556
MFPGGTGPASGLKTDALPAIWAQRTTFDGHAKKLIAEADKLVAVAGSGNAAAVGAQFKAVGGTCGGCHKQFRADD